MAKRLGKTFLFLLIIVLSLIAIFGALGYYAYVVASRITGGENFSTEEICVDPSFLKVEYSKKTDRLVKEAIPYIYIAVFGVDKRYMNENGRSDTNLLVKVDFLSKKVKVISILRDLLVEIPGYGQNKFNAAFSFGEVKLALGTLNKTFNLGVTKYAVVNFGIAEQLIDAVGGVTIEVKPEELEQLNLCIKELARLSKDGYVPLINTPGTHLLNGRQAVAYSRIRKVGNGDITRVQRQQKVLAEVFRKAKSMSIPTRFKLIDMVSRNLKTNLSIEELKILAFEDYSIYTIETFRIPAPGTFREAIIDIAGTPSFVFIADLEKNKEMLHEFLEN